MKSRQETEIDIQELKRTLHKQEYSFFDAKKRDALLENVELLFNYADENDLWDDYCWGSEESVFYTCMYVAMEINFVTTDIVKNIEVFYNYVREWFRDKADHYRGRADRGYINPDKIGETMCKDCAAELIEVLKQAEDES